MTDFIHIVCLDAPAPPDYGGAIDMFYKIHAMAASGKKVILHYFDYSNREMSALQEICAEVHAYPRKKTLPVLTPYIVASRINETLVNRLNADDHPILLEGIHCSGIVPRIKDQERIVLRIHNDEALYYKKLAGLEKTGFKKMYFRWESLLLKNYQARLPRNLKLACLSQKDHESFSHMGFSRSHFIPCFIPWHQVRIYEGMGRYCLYHGNMGVAENEEAAIWLMEKVFSVTKQPFTIAGKSISKRLKNKAASYSNVQLVTDPSITELDQIIRYAQVHVLPSFNSTGVKLKLLHVLLEGRHCLTNAAGVEGSLVSEAVILAEEPEEFIRHVERLYHLPFGGPGKKKRQEVLALYNNDRNVQSLNELW